MARSSSSRWSRPFVSGQTRPEKRPCNYDCSIPDGTTQGPEDLEKVLGVFFTPEGSPKPISSKAARRTGRESPEAAGWTSKQISVAEAPFAPCRERPPGTIFDNSSRSASCRPAQEVKQHRGPAAPGPARSENRRACRAKSS